MSSATPLIARLRHVAPEAIAFGIIGAGNTLLYMAITWAALPIGAVKVDERAAGDVDDQRVTSELSKIPAIKDVRVIRV